MQALCQASLVGSARNIQKTLPWVGHIALSGVLFTVKSK